MLKIHFNPMTNAFIHSYKPIKLYIYEHQTYPYAALNPFVKALLFGDSVFKRGIHLFEVSKDPSTADLFLFPCDVDYFENQEDQIYPRLQFYSGNEARHVFYDTRDSPEPFPSVKSICLKTSLNKKYISDSIICIPYLEIVDDFFFTSFSAVI